MLFIGILLFVIKAGSRRQLKYKLNTPKFIRNINTFFDLELPTMAHHDTLEYFLTRLKTGELEILRRKMIQRLLRMKKLTSYRLFGTYYLVALDGTGNLTFKMPHCDKCLVRLSANGEKRYFHPVLEAKIVTRNGLALSLGTEFVENEQRLDCEMDEKERQDCELKAAYRLLARLKKNYPQLPICLLGDGLYANQQIMQICAKNDWRYIVTFKEGSLPNAYAEFEALKKVLPGNTHRTVNNHVNCLYHWVNDIEHAGHKINAAECQESKNKNNAVQTRTFCFITNLPCKAENVEALVNQGGRMRWKIENEGFNMQKNGGYNLEHQFSRKLNALKNYYLLMQIAHLLNQLVEKSNYLRQRWDHFGCIKNLSEKLTAELTLLEIDFAGIFKPCSFYITLDTG